MRFRGTVYRAHNPQWAWTPLSGEGTRRHGERFNKRGVPALWGKRLAAFADCLESRRVRIVRRSSQRAVAELALIPGDEGVEVIRFVDFVRRFEEEVEAQRWLAPVERALGRMEHTADRQRVLRYGIVVHAMIDTLDPDHEVSKVRRSYANKLSYKSWNELERRVFRVYLKFVKGTRKYLGPRRRRPQGGGRRH